MKKKSHHNVRRFLCVASVLTLCDLLGGGTVNAQQEAPTPSEVIHLRLEVSKKKILTGEPIFSFFILSGPKDKMPDSPRFQFLVNGVPVEVDPRMSAEERARDFKWQSVQRGDHVEYRAYVMAFTDTSAEVPRVVTARAGKFSVHVAEQTSGLVSPAVEVEVLEPQGETKRAAETFLSDTALRAFLGGDVDELVKLVKSYPDSVYAPIASAFIGVGQWQANEREFAQAKVKAIKEKLPHEAIERIVAEHRKKLAELREHFIKARRLGVPSPLEELVMFYQARCEYESGNKMETFKILKQLIDTYGSANGLFVTEAREAAAELEQELPLRDK
jgi:hypothetical protein